MVRRPPAGRRRFSLEATISRSTDAQHLDAAFVPRDAKVTVRVVYLARLRDAFGRGEELLGLAGPTPRVADVLASLRARGGAHAVELAPGRAVRVAVNHAMTGDDTPLHEGDEVALLPPVTGG